MNDFKAEPDSLRRAMLDAVERVFDSGWYVLGNEVVNFENNWASTCGAEFAVGTANGMDALEISLRALGIGEGDEVVTTSMTAFATVLSILRTGATPVLADIDLSTGLLCMESAARCISRKTKAIVLVHLYGQVRAMGAWLAFCESNGVHLVEDCAQAHLAKSEGRMAGSFGIMAAFSFYPTKNLGAVGDAGLITTSSKELADKAKQLRNYGQSIRYHHPVVGLNSRLDEIQAAILSVRLGTLSEYTIRRRTIANYYDEQLTNQFVSKMSAPDEPSAHVYHLYILQTDFRQQLQDHLLSHGIQTFIHYPIPIHHQKPCLTCRRDPEGLTNSERHAETCISIPCHPQLSSDDLHYIAETINSFQAE
ncbi:DegT/DnrJ/EryC1/StrS family aminotransferase [Betaproteobacteria bacterium LSUCC0117]|nr:DegT/DnrJ/EryC1/StrS family aminotransferase [Betaproteobacteria bacterium LSUCC0117]